MQSGKYERQKVNILSLKSRPLSSVLKVSSPIILYPSIAASSHHGLHIIPVPYQINGSDCGVFVCRYAYAIFQLRHFGFTYGDAGVYSDSNPPFHDLISDQEYFKFDMHDIVRFRQEFKTLIQRLLDVFLTWKKAAKPLKFAEENTMKTFDPNVVALPPSPTHREATHPPQQRHTRSMAL